MRRSLAFALLMFLLAVCLGLKASGQADSA